jgi:class 3 adenylate cyclase
MPASVVASVVFLRIPDFARRSASEQARLRAQLEAVIAVTTAELDPVGRIVLEASDGAAIVLLRDPVGALRLAQRALTAGAAGLPLSAGLNHGALQLAGRKGAEGMTGDGIAVAASIAEFAASSRLLASRSFRHALADAVPGREVSLVAAGSFKDAGLRDHEVFALDEKAVARRELRYALATMILVLGLMGGGMAARISADSNKPFATAVMDKYPYVRELVKRVSY